jgi:hypothetical protein
LRERLKHPYFKIQNVKEEQNQAWRSSKPQRNGKKGVKSWDSVGSRL